MQNFVTARSLWQQDITFKERGAAGGKAAILIGITAWLYYRKIWAVPALIPLGIWLYREFLKEEKQIDIDDDEIGYVALHIHSALEKESVSVSMQMARAVRDCVSMIEEQRGIHINVMSLSYNRLMNHVKYMVARVLKGESLKVDMNDYVQHNFPESYELATTVCDHLSHALRKPLEELEIGYLAMHIERVSQDDE